MFISGTNEPASKNYFGNGGLIDDGSESHPSLYKRTVEQFVNAVEDVRQRYPDSFTKFFDHHDIDPSYDEGNNFDKADLIHELLTDMVLGTTEEYMDYLFFFRVVDKVTFHYIPEDIPEVDITTK